jgi:hypothetical protein
MLLVACEDVTNPPITPEAIRAELQRYQNADIQVDLRAAISKGDRRFLRMADHEPNYPGLEPNDMSLVARYGQRTLLFTEPPIEGVDRTRMVEAARSYATNYNIFLRENVAPR